MAKLLYPTLVSIFFGSLFAEAVWTRSPSSAVTTFFIVCVLWLLSYFVPPRLFHYSNDQLAPIVLTQLMQRTGVAIACVMSASELVLMVTGLWADLSFIEEVYAFTFIGIALFHGFGGPFAYHIVYLQETKQYDSNQLAAVLIAFTLMLFIITLVVFVLDFGLSRDAHIHRRDLLVFTTVLLGYGWTVYKIAHH
jgi:hypothetical protein